MLKKVVLKQAENTSTAYYIETSKVAYIQVGYSSDDTKFITLYMQGRESPVIQFSLSDDNLIKKFIDLFNESNSTNEIEINFNEKDSKWKS